MLVANVICRWAAISVPWSQVSDRHRWLGSVAIAASIAVWTASALLTVGQVQQQGVAGRAFDQRADRGSIVFAEDEVALPVSGHGPVGRLRGPLADHHLVDDAASSSAATGLADRPPGTQT